MHAALRPIAAAAAAAAVSPALAQAGPEPLWEVGAFAIGVSQQAYPGADQSVRRAIALPYFLYRGEVVRVDRGTAGLRAIKRPEWELDIGFAGAFGSNSNDIDARRGMPDLGTLVEFGPRLTWNFDPAPEEDRRGRWRLELPLRGVFDLSDSLASRGASFEPELRFSRRSVGGFSYAVSFGAVFGDRRLAGTFYDVAPRFATAERPAYEANAGLIAWRTSLQLTQRIGGDWRVFGFARIDSVAGAENRASPLVRKTSGGTFGIGASWSWMRSERAGVD